MTGPYTSAKRVRLAQKRRKHNRLLAVVILILFILAYGGVGFGLTHEALRITNVVVSGNSAVSAESMVATARQGLAVTNRLQLFGGTIFTYDKGQIRGQLMHIYPRLSSVELTATKIDTLDIRVTERMAVAQWCDGDYAAVPLSGEGPMPVSTCYLVDENGFVFAEVGPAAEGLVVYTGGLAEGALRQSLLHGEFAYVHTFTTSLVGAGVTPTKVRLLDGEIEVLSTGHPILKIKLDEHLGRTASYIEAVLGSVDYKQHTESEDVSYIDVRFGNRVYYK